MHHCLLNRSLSSPALRWSRSLCILVDEMDIIHTNNSQTIHTNNSQTIHTQFTIHTIIQPCKARMIISGFLLIPLKRSTRSLLSTLSRRHSRRWSSSQGEPRPFPIDNTKSRVERRREGGGERIVVVSLYVMLCMLCYVISSSSYSFSPNSTLHVALSHRYHDLCMLCMLCWCNTMGCMYVDVM